MQAIKISKLVKKNQRGIMKKNFVLTFIVLLITGGHIGSTAEAALPAFPEFTRFRTRVTGMRGEEYGD
jgi:hypothetical protein